VSLCINDGAISCPKIVLYRLSTPGFQKLGGCLKALQGPNQFHSARPSGYSRKKIHGVRPPTKGANCYKLPIIAFGQICRVLSKGIRSLQPFI
jgi:hypothetical protein